MKKLLYLAVVILFAACNDDDNDRTVVPTEAITKAFAIDFPNAINVVWTRSLNEYYIADFNRSTSTTAPTSVQATEAWYTADGKRELIETDFNNINELPVPIQAGINTWLENRLNTSNQKFIVDDIDQIERANEADVYKIEVEYDPETSNEIEYDLFFNTAGLLLSEVLDVDGDDIDENANVPTPAEIQTYINDNYTNARVLGVEIEIENSKKFYNVELIAGQTEGSLENVEFELMFSFDTKVFLMEEADLKFSQAPEALQTALKAIVATASDMNIEIERITLAGKAATYKIDADDAAEVLDDRVFNADGTEIK